MAEDKVKLPKWAWAIIITGVLSLITYVHKRDVDALDANTKAVSELSVSIAKITGSIDTVRSDVQGTIGRLLDKVEDLEKENADYEQRLRKLEGKR
jgi:peptidoglycan hydrolase CwlO-like protein